MMKRSFNALIWLMVFSLLIPWRWRKARPPCA